MIECAPIFYFPLERWVLVCVSLHVTSKTWERVFKTYLGQKHTLTRLFVTHDAPHILNFLVQRLASENVVPSVCTWESYKNDKKWLNTFSSLCTGTVPVVGCFTHISNLDNILYYQMMIPYIHHHKTEDQKILCVGVQYIRRVGGTIRYNQSWYSVYSTYFYCRESLQVVS
jgi:hypothetical protein